MSEYHEALCTHYNTLLQSVQPEQEELDALAEMFHLSMKHEVLDKCLKVLDPLLSQSLHLQPGVLSFLCTVELLLLLRWVVPVRLYIPYTICILYTLYDVFGDHKVQMVIQQLHEADIRIVG